MPASRDLEIRARSGESFGYPVKGGVRLFRKSIVAVTAAGLAVPAGTAGAVAVVGLADGRVDNRDGADGDTKVCAERGCFGLTLAVAFADIGKPVYATDDATITLDGTGGKLLVGKIVGIGEGSTWVAVG
ncbi:MAG TPA: hypothetical protein VGV39_00970 [Mesorhizobium sp.]|jgi:hypothetical protein|uniref:hypothetical protein n=1 Tax=Mesorhizobium sp. TaxID=1871066 RepID=UPI002DDD1856|nr:hypothetical protein [Mesorhizobium sp.]HEV2501613.1 hypothetical protein [Mesorhizobium sp.]